MLTIILHILTPVSMLSDNTNLTDLLLILRTRYNSIVMKVLAIDPGYGRCGMAVVEKSGGGKEALLYSDCVVTSSTTDFPARLATVAAECERIIKNFSPECMALEKLYFQKNQKTAMRVAEVRGALLQVAAEHGLPVVEYTPGEVKVAAAGFGGADKQAVAKMLHALMKIDKAIKHDDEYDAIAIGVTHLVRLR
jgi:crossover junction endodeoxyribonuclease RuvC